MKRIHMLPMLAIAAMVTLSLTAAPPTFQLVGTSEVGTRLSACILNTSNSELIQLDSTAEPSTTEWQITEIIRNRSGDVIRLLIKKGNDSQWLGLTGTPEVANTTSTPQPMPGLDLPESSLSRLHDQRTYRARIKPHPVARKALREPSDIDPLPQSSRHIRR